MQRRTKTTTGAKELYMHALQPRSNAYDQYCCSTVMNALDVALGAHLRKLMLPSRPMRVKYGTVPPKLLTAILYGCRTALPLRSIAQAQELGPQWFLYPISTLSDEGKWENNAVVLIPGYSAPVPLTRSA